MTIDATRTLAAFLAGLRYEAIPAAVVARCQDLFLDWAGCALAGKGRHPTPLFQAYARRMGPAGGGAQVLVDGRRTSAYFAALVNGAASHLVEQDDLHNGSVLHPATVVFPAALALAQAEKRSGRALLTAAVAGYEAGIRIGEFLGRSHYRVFHTTGTAGTLAAAVAAGKLLDLDEEGFVHLLGTAATQAAGLWEFLRDAADSKQLHTAKAAADGVLSAYLVADGLSAARHALEGPQGLAAGTSRDADPARLVDGLGRRWALAETSFKYHASCRHTHPAADALARLLSEHALAAAEVDAVVAHVHQGALDVLGLVDVPATVHQAKFSMGTVLGLIAVHGAAGLEEFDRHALSDPDVAAFRARVRMERDEDVDAAYPRQWIGKVSVRTADGRVLHARVDVPRGDPGNTLSRPELEAKFRRLVASTAALDEAGVERLVRIAWQLPELARVPELVPTAQVSA